MARHRYHPACLLFPKLGDQELQELADNIKVKGLLHDIVRYRGEILDGRNRLAACEIAGVEPRFVEWDGKGSPTEWVISENLIRRHLTSSQRAVVANDLLPMLESEAKERQRLSVGRGKKVAKKLATFSANGNGKASQVAARLMKTNSAYIESVKAIGRQAPELLEEIRSGHLRIPDAVTVAKMPKARRLKVLKAIRAAGPETKLKGIIQDGEDGEDGEYSPNYWSRTASQVEERPQNYQTPPHVVHPLLRHIPKNWVVWECACGKGNISSYLEEQGRQVIATDIKTGRDFLEWKPRRHFDCVITNPPHRHMSAFLRRCYQLGKPFALLLPLLALEGQERHALYREHGLQLMFFDKRVVYEPEHGQVRSDAIPFASLWFCHRLLKKDVIFEQLVEE